MEISKECGGKVNTDWWFKKSDVVKLYDLGEEFGIEGGQVMEYGTYKEYDPNEMEDLLKHFGGIYALVSGEGKKYFLYLVIKIKL